MINLIPNKVKKFWEHWNIRGVILLSLALQIFLIMFSPLRKREQKRLVVFSIWATYLLADWAANFCVGLIASNQDPRRKTIISTQSDLQAFWAPFLLMHLGGPDTITAFSLEDNELWLRHMLAFFVQVISCLYVFSLTVPGNRLWIPTVLVFISGMIKYGERTCALYLASNDRFRDSMNGEPNPGSNFSRLMLKYLGKKEANLPTKLVAIPDLHELPQDAPEEGNLPDEIVVLHAYDFFRRFKGIIVDMIFSFPDRNECRQYFHRRSAGDALRVIEVELNFFYEAFYTKFFVVRGKFGCLCRFVAISCVVVALGLFFLADKDKQGFDAFDVRVTYALLCGAVALDSVALLMLLFSDRTVVSLYRSRLRAIRILVPYLILKRPKWSKCKMEPYTKFTELSNWMINRRWNGSISGFNLVSYSPILGQFQWIKHSNIVMGLYKDKNPFILELWSFIFVELKRKSVEAEDVDITRMICDSRGGWVLQEGSISQDHIDKLMPFVDANKVTFDESLIMWHVATHICYAAGTGDRYEQVDEREFSKVLSDYMLYLLVVQSEVIAAVAGIGQKRFQDTLAEVTEVFKKIKVKNDVKGCKTLLEVNLDYKPNDASRGDSKSLLFEACALAKKLMELRIGIKWKIVSQVWVELMSFAACNCRISAHLQHLSKGGEFISLVWLLMFHLGLGKQFQIKGAQKKLIVYK